MAHGFMLSFTCMGVVTLLSSVVFRRIDTAAPPASAAAPIRVSAAVSSPGGA